MATNLNALVMKISADTSGLAEGVRLTRSEISRLNRIQQMAKTDSDKLQQATETLQKGFAAGAIDAERLQKGLDEVRKRYGSTSQAARDHAAAVERGLAVVRRTTPAIEGIKDQFRDLMAAQKAGKITADEYARSKAALVEQTKKLKAAEFAQTDEGKKLAEQQRQAEQQTRRVRQQIEASIAPADRLERQIQELNQEYRRGNVSAADYARTQNRLQKELDETNQAVLGQDRSMQLLTRAIGGLTVGYVAARAFDALRDSIAESMAEIDNTAKQAAKLGLLTDELVGLRLAASEFSGVSEGQFDTALQRMTRRIAEASQGTGEAQAAIKELGLDAKTLANAGPAESFRQIASSIQDVEGESQRLRIAFKLFDSEGAALVTTLAAGREGIEGVERAADELGVTFSNMDAAQVEAANDALGRARAAVDGMATQLTIVLAPAIQLVAEDMQAFLAWIQQANVSIPQASIAVAALYGSVSDLATALAGVTAIASGQTILGLGLLQDAAQLDGARDAVVRATTSMAKAYAAARKNAEEFSEAAEETPELDLSANVDAINQEIDRLKDRNLELKNGAEWYAKYQDEKKSKQFEEGATDEQKLLMDTLRKQNTELEKAAKLEEKRLEAVKKRVEEDNKNRDEVIERGNTFLESLKTPIQNLTDQLVQAEMEYKNGSIDWEQWQNAQLASEDQFKNANDKPIKIELPPVLRRDSAEEYRMVTQLVSGQRNEQQRRHSEAMEIRRAHLTALQRVETAIENMEPAESV
ncbi:hypothetical protein [Rhodopirellula europaea]|uniref:hypothetical protein n=1 Tax=Rhodopirellula europaea TaxID=1263866 RepID=UPI003D2E99D2